MSLNRYFEANNLDYDAFKPPSRPRTMPQITGPIDPAVLKREARIYGSLKIRDGYRETEFKVELLAKDGLVHDVGTPKVWNFGIERIQPELFLDESLSQSTNQTSHSDNLLNLSKKQQRKLERREMIASRKKQRKQEKRLKKKLEEEEEEEENADDLIEIEASSDKVEILDASGATLEAMKIDSFGVKTDKSKSYLNDDKKNKLPLSTTVTAVESDPSTHLGTKSKSKKYSNKMGEWDGEKSQYLRTLVSAQPSDSDIDWVNITKIMNEKKYAVAVSVEVVKKYGKRMRKDDLRKGTASENIDDRNGIQVVKTKSRREREPIAIPKQVSILDKIIGFLGI